MLAPRLRSGQASDLTTVVIITHNYGRYLGDAIASVVDQTVRPRLFIMDDASTDGTEVIVDCHREEHPWLEYRKSASIVGLSGTRNNAARSVGTDWIVYLDADDWLDTRFIERGERCIKASRDIDVLATDMTVVRDGRRPFVSKTRLPASWHGLLRRNTIVQTSLIRRKMVLALGGYDETLDFEDWDFWIRAMKAGYRIERLPAAHVYRREHGLNKSKTCDEVLATDQIRARHPLR